MAEPHFVKTQKTARFYTSGPMDQEYKTVCFVLHGYGQLAAYFIRDFEKAALHDVLFVAPEALHRFYLQKPSKRVGASWMTREDRLNDISDYCHYLDRVYEKVMQQNQTFEKVGVLGFSQGVATACRWYISTAHHFDFLINYAGSFPPDLDEEKAKSKMQDIPVHVVIGDQDEYIDREELKSQEEILNSFSKKGHFTKFAGKHKIYPEVLQKIFKNDRGL